MITESGIALDISCDNTPRQQVIGGTQAALNEFATLLMAAGYEPVKLGVSGAWHTRLMEDGVGDDSNLLIVFYVQIMPDDFVMQLHRF